jgi:protein-export membrane protein SecD
MFKKRILALVLLLAGVLIGWFVYSSEMSGGNHKFKLGLDLNGGTELVYKADVSKLASSEIGNSMDTLRNVIDRRVNAFGVTEPVVQVENVGLVGGENAHQLIVDLPGVTNIDKAVAMIGATPLLEFRLQDETVATSSITSTTSLDTIFKPTGLTGRLLSHSSVELDSRTAQAVVALQFNSEGDQLFAKITRENVGKTLAIFLDGQPISLPVIKEEITGGKATISGGFMGSAGRAEAKTLVNNLNLGSLPVPIELISTQTIGATLGESATNAAVKAGLIAFIFIALFLILWYRLPGLLAVIALAIYTAINLALFKLIPVTMTSAGIAGFILSVGMAVDANILIFERMKEELRKGRELGDAVKEGFARAWLSIRDSNTSSLITALILFMFSSTSIVKGFALVFGLGVLVSMFTAITASRTLLLSIKHDHSSRFLKFLFGYSSQK